MKGRLWHLSRRRHNLAQVSSATTWHLSRRRSFQLASHDVLVACFLFHTPHVLMHIGLLSFVGLDGSQNDTGHP